MSATPSRSSGSRVVEVTAFPISYRLPEGSGITLGVGRVVKRDAVVVKVVTEGGIVGWGESHHGRAPGTIAHLVNTNLRQLVVGRDAVEVNGIWDAIYAVQLRSHGMGAATAMAMSGIDMALWDIRGKMVGWPVCQLLGGASRSIPAYAGGVSLGWQDPQSLVAEAQPLVDSGYKAVKLRVGDTPKRDLERVEAVRRAFGDDLAILVDANTRYDLADARQTIPHYAALNVGWLEEPFAPHDHRSYAIAAGFSTMPLAAGENHYTRFEFTRVVEDGNIRILQPDLSKVGGITEALRVASIASAWKLPMAPHTCITGINMAATIHLLASIPNALYFESDVSHPNPLRDELVSTPYRIDAEGCVRPLEGPGLGVEVNEDFIRRHPVIEGPSYV